MALHLCAGLEGHCCKPRAELESFFTLNFESRAGDIGCDPEGIRTPALHRDRVAC